MHRQVSEFDLKDFKSTPKADEKSTPTHTYARTHARTCSHTHTCAHVRTRTHTHVHTHSPTRTHTLSLSLSLSHTHTHTRAHTHTHTHTHTVHRSWLGVAGVLVVMPHVVLNLLLPYLGGLAAAADLPVIDAMVPGMVHKPTYSSRSCESNRCDVRPSWLNFWKPIPVSLSF